MAGALPDPAGRRRRPTRSCRCPQLPLLTEAERRQLLVEWNDTARRLPARGVPPRAVRGPGGAHARRRGRGLRRTRTLTYRELNRRANQLAHHLRALGVGPEALVGICLERSLELVVGLLGILKAGGAYVPLDPAYPPERLAFMLEDAQRARAAHPARSWPARCPRTRRTCCCLDADADTARARPQRQPAARRRAPTTSPTSSTPRAPPAGPRAWPSSTRNAVRLPALGPARVFEPRDLAGTLAATSICLRPRPSSSSSLPLSRGGTVILASNVLELPRPARRRSRHARQHRRPRAMSELLRSSSLPAGVRVVNLAGEPLLHLAGAPAPPAARACERVHNFYGPTETTTYSTFTPARARRDRPPSAGPSPTPGCTCSTATSSRCPRGVPGELYIGGAGLARGYLDRPELTAERFVPDPFSTTPAPGCTAPATWPAGCPTATSSSSAARDHQVKVRGFRIELGEIEAVLSQHPAVRAGGRASPARTRPATSGWWPTSRRTGSAPSRRAALLPQAAPARVHGALGLRAARGAAAHPQRQGRPQGPARAGRSSSRRRPTYVASAHADRGDAGRPSGRRCSAWSAWACTTTSSTWAATPCSPPRSSPACAPGLRVELPLRALFEAPTVAELAARIDAALRDEPPRPRFRRWCPCRAQGALPLSFAQQRLWFLDQLEPGSPFYNIPSAAPARRPARRARAASAAFQELVRRHEALRTTFPTRDGEPVQVIAPPWPATSVRWWT